MKRMNKALEYIGSNVHEIIISGLATTRRYTEWYKEREMKIEDLIWKNKKNEQTHHGEAKREQLSGRVAESSSEREHNCVAKWSLCFSKGIGDTNKTMQSQEHWYDKFGYNSLCTIQDSKGISTCVVNVNSKSPLHRYISFCLHVDHCSECPWLPRPQVRCVNSKQNGKVLAGQCDVKRMQNGKNNTIWAN